MVTLGDLDVEAEERRTILKVVALFGLSSATAFVTRDSDDTSGFVGAAGGAVSRAASGAADSVEDAFGDGVRLISADTWSFEIFLADTLGEIDDARSAATTIGVVGEGSLYVLEDDASTTKQFDIADSTMEFIIADTLSDAESTVNNLPAFAFIRGTNSTHLLEAS